MLKWNLGREELPQSRRPLRFQKHQELPAITDLLPPLRDIRAFTLIASIHRKHWEAHSPAKEEKDKWIIHVDCEQTNLGQRKAGE